MPIGRIFGAQTAWTTVEMSVMKKQALKRQKSHETTADTQDVSKFY